MILDNMPNTDAICTSINNGGIEKHLVKNKNDIMIELE